MSELTSLAFERTDSFEFKPHLPDHYKPQFESAAGSGFELLIKEPIRLQDGDEFVYCYSFRRDRERYRRTWHWTHPFRRQRHLAKVGEGSGDPLSVIRGQFIKPKSDDELISRSVPEYPQIEMIVFVHDAWNCEQAFHNYVRRYQYLGGAGYEFFETNGAELLQFSKIWKKSRKRAEQIAKWAHRKV